MLLGNLIVDSKSLPKLPAQLSYAYYANVEYLPNFVGVRGTESFGKYLGTWAGIAVASRKDKIVGNRLRKETWFNF